ncbi:MAG: LysR family transcriptional regulator [Clostridiales bacterium]|nr:LysR family transcriptional regulator [Clostridiales bacterium]
MKAFAMVAECRNISKASKELFISQPALSKKMSDLEKELGVALLVRDNRSASLTAAGEFFYKRSQEIIRNTEQLAFEMRKMGHDNMSVIRVGMSGIERAFLPPYIREFHLAYPEIDYDVQYGNAVKIKEALSTGEIDVGFLLDFDAERLTGFSNRMLFRARFCVVLPKGHPLRTRDSLTLEELHEEILITFSSTSSLANTLKMFRQANFNPQHITLKENIEDVFLAVENGMGIGILLDNVKSWFHSQYVTFVSLDNEDFVNYVCAVWRERPDDKMIQKFLNYLSNAMASKLL